MRRAVGWSDGTPQPCKKRKGRGGGGGLGGGGIQKNIALDLLQIITLRCFVCTNLFVRSNKISK
jgi:hypothetical protein